MTSICHCSVRRLPRPEISSTIDDVALAAAPTMGRGTSVPSRTAKRSCSASSRCPWSRKKMTLCSSRSWLMARMTSSEAEARWRTSAFSAALRCS